MAPVKISSTHGAPLSSSTLKPRTATWPAPRDLQANQTNSLFARFNRLLECADAKERARSHLVDRPTTHGVSIERPSGSAFVLRFDVTREDGSHGSYIDT